MSAKILIIRHGTTKLNGDGQGDSAERIRGWMNVELSDKGRREVEAAGREFAKAPIREIWCSPLNRARDTADAVAKPHDPLPEVHPNVSLMPWQLGDMQGQHAKIAIPVMNHFIKNETAAPPHGEPFRSFRLRALQFLSRKIHEFDAHGDDYLAVLVTHSRVLQLVHAWIAAGCPEDLSIDVGAMIKYEGAVPPGGHLWLKIEDAATKGKTN